METIHKLEQRVSGDSGIDAIRMCLPTGSNAIEQIQNNQKGMNYFSFSFG